MEEGDGDGQAGQGSIKRSCPPASEIRVLGNPFYRAPNRRVL